MVTTKTVNAMKARQAALRKLVEQHTNEFNELLGVEREKLGLPPDPEAAKREAKIARLRKQLAELEATSNNSA